MRLSEQAARVPRGHCAGLEGPVRCCRIALSFAGLLCAAGLPILAAPLPALAQGQAAGSSAPGRSAAGAKPWVAPRTADGQPDLQGIWTNNSATPFERPAELAGRATLTDAEVRELQKSASELFNGETDAGFGDAVFKAALQRARGSEADIKKTNGFDVVTGNYNQFWLVDREFDNRTSVVTDPPDGRVPALTPDAQRRQADEIAYRKAHPADGPEDLPLGYRCVNFGVPKLGAGYNSYHHIVQSPGYVAILSEMAHDARIIPLDGRPHVNSSLQQWNGDARGRWEGNTLVVETTNFSPKSEFRGSHENLRLVERFTRVGPKTLNYEVQISDPTTWTKPWAAMIPFKSSTDQIFEYACHEGNEGLPGALSGTRTQEAEAAQKKGSN